MSSFRFLFLTRPACHLCDDARPLVLAAANKAGVHLAEVDVDSDDELIVKYGLRIPVVLSPDGVVVAEGRIEDGRALRRNMKKVASG